MTKVSLNPPSAIWRSAVPVFRDLGTRGTDSGKELSVHFVESAKVLNVFEVAGALYYVSEAVASALQDLSDMVERQSGFFFNRSADHGARPQVQWSLSADEKPAVDLDPCRVRTRRRHLVRMLDFNFRHLVWPLYNVKGVQLSSHCSSRWFTKVGNAF